MILLLAALGMAMSPEEAVIAALTHDPQLAAAEARVEVAEGARSAARGFRENPQAAGRWGADRLELELSQALSLTGEGFAASRSAGAALDAAMAARDRARLVTAAEARRAWLRAAVAAAELQIATEELTAATRLREAAELQVAAGDLAAFDLHLARLEEARAVGRVLNARAELGASGAVLAALTGDPDATATGDPALAAPQAGVAGVRDDVVAAEAEVEAAEAAVRRERAAAMPELALGVFYEADAGRRVVGPTVAVEVPIWHRNPAGIGEARGDLRIAEAELQSSRARADAERAAAQDTISTVGPLVALLGDDPAADTAAVLAGVDAAWRAGEINLSEATFLRGRAIEGRRAWVSARAELAEAQIAAALAEGSAALVP